MGPRLSVGFDLVGLEDVENAITRFGERYLRRVFTDQELSDCCDDTAGLAACFAAKEAVIKALSPGAGEPVPWRSVGVLSSGPGAPSIRLTGPASRLARCRGISHLQLGLSRTGAVAGAVVIGRGPLQELNGRS